MPRCDPIMAADKIPHRGTLHIASCHKISSGETLSHILHIVPRNILNVARFLTLRNFSSFSQLLLFELLFLFWPDFTIIYKQLMHSHQAYICKMILQNSCLLRLFGSTHNCYFLSEKSLACLKT